MKKITAADLLRLGFEKVDVDDEFLDEDEDQYFYFKFPAGDECVSQLLTADEDNINDTYNVDVGNDVVMKIKDLTDLELLMGIIERSA